MFDKAASAYTTLGFELIGLIVAMTYLGTYIDARFAWGGWGLISGITIAFLGWVTHLYIVVQTLAKAEKSSDRDSS